MDKQKQLEKHRKLKWQEEERTMATLAKPVSRTFEVSPKKMEAFKKLDTKPAFRAAIKRFRKHGGKIQSDD